MKILILILVMALSGCGAGYISQYNTHPLQFYSEDKGQRPSLSELQENKKANIVYEKNKTVVVVKEDKHSWEGIVVFLLIPVPILFPIRHDLTYTFENGILVSKSGTQEHHEDYTGCFFIIFDAFCGTKIHL